MPDGAGGFFLFLFESFAARALLGSLVAALLIELILRRDGVRSVTGRRVLLVVPLVVAGVLAVASANRGFLPNVWVDTDRIAAAGALMDVLGDIQIIGGTVDLLVAGYLLTVAVLVARRMAGVISARRMRRESPLAPSAVRARALRLALQTGIAPPEVRLRRDCPGGAFTTGLRRPWIALDPALTATLDRAELDALLAHEMAHIRRRDPLLCVVTGLLRDLTFFLPGIHLANVWLRREQEEAADDLAATNTQRPGALASTILKVWEAQTGRMQLVNACAAVRPARGRHRLLGLVRPSRAPEPPHVVIRVQRLIRPLQAVAHPMTRHELALPATVLTLAVTVGVLVPAWITHVLDNDGVLVRVFAAPAATQVESPAFATFRATAPADLSSQPAVAAPVDDDDLLCPCIESAAQLRAGRSAGTAPSHSQLVWSSDGRDPWELQNLHEQARLRVNRELLSWRAAQREVGFFTVSRNPTER